MRSSESRIAVSKAFALAQASAKKALKDSTNPHFKSKYSDLASVWDAACESLAANGLFALQDLTNIDGGVAVTTYIGHSSGEWLEFGPLIMPVADQRPHTYGSASTYGRRYSLAAALGIVPDDDDGNGATFITREQAEIITLRMEFLTPEQANGFMSWIAKTYNAKSVTMIPATCYDAVKTNLIEARARAQKGNSRDRSS